MKIERGIISADISNDHVHVRGVGTLYKLNSASLFERSYKNYESVLGVILEKEYTVCHEFELTTGEKFFGYIINNGFGSNAVRVQVINDFDHKTHFPYNQDKDYVLGPQLVIKKESILDFLDEV